MFWTQAAKFDEFSLMSIIGKNVEIFDFFLASHTIFCGYNNIDCETLYEMIKRQQANVCPFKSYWNQFPRIQCEH